MSILERAYEAAAAEIKKIIQSARSGSNVTALIFGIPCPLLEGLAVIWRSPLATWFFEKYE